MWQNLLPWLTRLLTWCALITEDTPAPCSSVRSVSVVLDSIKTPIQIYHAPFKVGDYNQQLASYYTQNEVQAMTLDYQSDAVAFIFAYDGRQEPNNHSWKSKFVTEIETGLENCSYEYIDAWEMNGNFPKINVQVAGNASGLAYFYHPKLLAHPPQTWQKQPMYGVSVHKDLKENIRFLGVIVIPTLRIQDMEFSPPPNVFNNTNELINFLERINNI